MQLRSHIKQHLSTDRSALPAQQETLSSHKTSHRLHALKETAEGVIALSIVVLLGLRFPLFIQSMHIIFALFFLIVFAIVVRYQRLAAYTTSLLAALGYGFLLWLQGHINAQPLFLAEPVMLLFSGILTSDLLALQRKRFQQAQSEAQQVTQRFQEMQQQHHKALEVNTELEHMVAGQSNSLITFSHQLTRLWRSTAQEFYQRSIELVAQQLEASSCAIYLRDGQHFHLYAAQSDYMQSLTTFHPDQLAPAYTIIARAVKEQRVVTLQDLLDQKESTTQETPSMVGPLLDEQGNVQGIIIAGKLPFHKCTPRTTRLFTALLKVIAPTLPTHKSTDTTTEIEIMPDEYDLVSSVA